MVDITVVTNKGRIGGNHGNNVPTTFSPSPKSVGQSITTTPADKSELPLPAIIGGAVAGLVLIGIVALGVYIWYRRKYPVRMVLGKDFQKFSNPAYNTKRMSALQLTAEDPLASYDVPLEQINEGFIIDKEDRNSLFDDDMTDTPRYLSHPENNDSDKADETSKPTENNSAHSQDSEKSSTESRRKSRKAILVTSEEPDSFVMTNELQENSEVEKHMDEGVEKTISSESMDGSEPVTSSSITNETESNGTLGTARTCVEQVGTGTGITPEEHTPDDAQNNNDSSIVVLKNESLIIQNTTSTSDEGGETTSEPEHLSKSNLSQNEHVFDDSITRVSSENFDHEIKSESNLSTSRQDHTNDTLSESFVVLDPSNHPPNDNQFDFANDLDRDSIDATGDLAGVNEFERPIGLRTGSLNNFIDSDEEIRVSAQDIDGFKLTSNDSIAALDGPIDYVNNIVNLGSRESNIHETISDNKQNEAENSPINIDIQNNGTIDTFGISTNQECDTKENVDLEKLKLGLDLIKQSAITSVGSPGTTTAKLSPENLVLECPPPTPTIKFDSIILEPDFSSIDNKITYDQKFRSVPDVRIQRSLTFDSDDALSNRRRARTSLDNNLNATLSDSFQSLISKGNNLEHQETSTQCSTSSYIGEVTDVYEHIEDKEVSSLDNDWNIALSDTFKPTTSETRQEEQSAPIMPTADTQPSFDFTELIGDNISGHKEDTSVTQQFGVLNKAFPDQFQTFIYENNAEEQQESLEVNARSIIDDDNDVTLLSNTVNAPLSDQFEFQSPMFASNPGEHHEPSIAASIPSDHIGDQGRPFHAALADTSSDPFQSLIALTNSAEQPMEITEMSSHEASKVVVTVPEEHKVDLGFNNFQTENKQEDRTTLLNFDDNTFAMDKPQPFELNFGDNESSMVIVDDFQSDKDSNNVSEKEEHFEITTSSESSRSWEMINEGSLNFVDVDYPPVDMNDPLVDMNDPPVDVNDPLVGMNDPPVDVTDLLVGINDPLVGMSGPPDNVGTKLLKIDPSSFDFDNDSGDSSDSSGDSDDSEHGDDDGTVEILNEDESNA